MITLSGLISLLHSASDSMPESVANTCNGTFV